MIFIHITAHNFSASNNDDEDDSYENYVKSWVGQIEPINLKFQIWLLSDKIRVYQKEQLFGHFCSFLFNGPSKNKYFSYKLKFLPTTDKIGGRWGLSEVEWQDLESREMMIMMHVAHGDERL